ncbi:WAP four-disulfide core domain protein 1 isoform X2 [Alexandromys fortis]|uniref:WAP four-disulfide core domain protein 1 isoform X2 n=1 Tax=Alexandromys fortis TaxID=100897 RepID=UPI0021530B92|nr:WAP four-disulfide core domain protein 1 isoform X2 [Microtus fortis]
MGCWGRKALWALGFLLLLGTSSAQDTWEALLPSRLVEKSRAEEGTPTGPRQPRADRCPPPPQTLPPGACQATRCHADSECPRHRRCCYNGCAYACLEAVPPPPAEACSTTEDGAEPLLCPTGYECHILRPGDPAQGIPNHGQCVKQRRQAEGRILRQKLHKQYPEGDSKNVAEPGKGQQRHFQ